MEMKDVVRQQVQASLLSAINDDREEDDKIKQEKHATEKEEENK